VKIATVAAMLFAVGLLAQDAPEPPAPPQPPRVVVNALAAASRSYLGVGVREVDAEIARQKKLPEERGVEITSVAENSPAEKAGLKKGDVVLEFNGQPVQGVEQFIRLVRETPVGRSVTLKVSRDGAIHTLTATIGKCRNCGPFGALSPFEIPDIQTWSFDLPNVYTSWRSGVLGIEAEALQSQLAEYFGVKEGVLVRSVKPDSPAARAGLRAGDVIIKAGETRVTKPRDISQALRSAGKSLELTIVRDKRETTVTVTLDRPAHEGRLMRRETIAWPGTRI
jgi:serine protease Do